jgi:biopolymer transport protein ExbB
MKVYRKFWIRSLCMAFGILWSASLLQAESLQQANTVQQRKLDEALERLRVQREAIQQEQIPLARALDEKTREVQELRREWLELQAIQNRDHYDLKSLEARVKDRQREYDYITRTLFPEYIATFQAVLSAGEKALYGEQIRQLNLFAESENKTEESMLERSVALIQQSMRRMRETLGGKSYSGEALDQDGKWVKGRFVQIGPVLYFADNEGVIAGVVGESLGLRPQVRSTGQANDRHIREYIANDKGVLPLDPSLQNALLLEETRDGLMEHLRKGGIWVIPIVAFALLATLASIFKSIQILAIRHPAPLVVHNLAILLRNKEYDKARKLAEVQPYPARDMLKGAVEHANESLELIEEVMYESMLSVQPRLERFLNVIAITASIAPLLGLLGTVTGIIKTFKLMHVFGAGDPKHLISGISEALITTELGLVLAIPALIIHALLSRKVTGIMARMEKLSVALINGLSRRSLAEDN